MAGGVFNCDRLSSILEPSESFYNSKSEGSYLASRWWLAPKLPFDLGRWQPTELANVSFCLRLSWPSLCFFDPADISSPAASSLGSEAGYLCSSPRSSDLFGEGAASSDEFFALDLPAPLFDWPILDEALHAYHACWSLDCSS